MHATRAQIALEARITLLVLLVDPPLNAEELGEYDRIPNSNPTLGCSPALAPYGTKKGGLQYAYS